MQLLQLARAGAVRVLVSDEIVTECREVLLRPEIRAKHKQTQTEIDALLNEIREEGSLIKPGASSVEGPDPKDAHLWHCLRAAPDAVLVTGDRALREKPPIWAEGRVLTPREWIDRYTQAK